ncbi:551_t:CDS:2 [Cetraspora pellucida]|uniref:551_t:CDS:1 n=1 Tax=Cetraspora pellucida TaxID=1433469 RepID=A0A9N9C819_9GLOM|nr:551_t:CDS:2 [Cetraspora pellucida]
MVTINMQSWQDPAFPDVSILQEITEDILVNFRKCKELKVIKKDELDQLDKQNNTFNKLTERRAMESLKMSEYLADVVKYLQLLSKENVNVTVIKQSLGLLLKTAKVQKDKSEELKNDYTSFYNELNKVKKRQLNTNIMFYLLVGLLVLIIAIACNIYLYTNLGHYNTLQHSDSAEKTLDDYSLNDACSFCKDIDHVKDVCRISDHTESTPYNFSINDGYEICGHFFEENCVTKDDSLGSQIVSLVKTQFFSISNIVNYRNFADQHCKVINQDILQNNKTFYEICEYLLANRKVTLMIKGLVNWIFQQDNNDQVTASDKRVNFVQHIKDRFPGINSNIITLNQFWKAQITIINDHISVFESMNANKINLPYQLVDLIIRLWDEECKRCKSCYYKLNESITLNSILE